MSNLAQVQIVFAVFDVLGIAYLWLTRERGYGGQVPSVPLQRWADAVEPIVPLNVR